MKKNPKSVSIGLCTLVKRIADYNKVARVADDNYTFLIEIFARLDDEIGVKISRNGIVVQSGVYHSKNRMVSFPNGIGDFEQYERILETLRGQKIVALRKALNKLE